MKRTVAQEIKLTILDLKNMLNSIIINSKKITYKDAEIFFINKKQFDQVYTLYLSSKSIFDNDKFANKRSSKNKKKKDPFYDIAKILYGDATIIAYKNFMKHRYVNITDEEKVKARIDIEHLIEIREIKKFYQELIEENKDTFSEEKIVTLNEEEKEKVEHIIRMKKFLIDEFKFLDIRITTFVDKKLYPTIRMIDENGKDIQEHLRVGVPNILLAHKNIFELQDDYRKDAKHIRFILSAEHAFGQIYFKRKENHGKD